MTYTEIWLTELGSCPPFRAHISFVSVQEDTLLLQLRHPDGEYCSLTEKQAGIDSSPPGKALALLEQGREYEFPYCIQHPGKEEVGKPTTPAMKALEPFVGQWSARNYDSEVSSGGRWRIRSAAFGRRMARLFGVGSSRAVVAQP